MCNEKLDFSGAIFDSKKGGGDGNQWWYINSTSLKWATSQQFLINSAELLFFLAK
jgi:hypothetical protein